MKLKFTLEGNQIMLNGVLFCDNTIHWSVASEEVIDEWLQQKKPQYERLLEEAETDPVFEIVNSDAYNFLRESLITAFSKFYYPQDANKPFEVIELCNSERSIVVMNGLHGVFGIHRWGGKTYTSSFMLEPDETWDINTIKLLKNMVEKHLDLLLLENELSQMVSSRLKRKWD